MLKQIYVYSKFSDFEKDYFQNLCAEKYILHFHDNIADNEQLSTFLQCQFCLGNVPLKWCYETENLEWMQLHSAGIDPYNQLAEQKFPITNLRGYFAESVAETTLAGIMAFYRGIDRLVRLQAEGKWVGNSIRPSLLKLHRNRVWVLGGGSIANKFIELLAPYNCQIIQTSLRDVIANSNSIEFFEKHSVDQDLIVLILPEIPESIHFLNADKIAKIEGKTVVVNVGRGSSIDESSLRTALKEGRIKGAVLDVTEVEPIAAYDAIWALPNVILTQHSAGGWDGEMLGKIDFFMKNLARFEAGEELENLIDTARGY